MVKRVLNYIVNIINNRDAVKSVYTKDNLIGDDYEIGDYTYGVPLILWNSGQKLIIGKFCAIADGVTIFLGGNHRIDWITTYPFSSFPDKWPEAQNISGHPGTKGDVCIGNDVWIGYGATIMSGISIGNGAAIAAKSVVTQNVEPYSIVAGNPARLIKKRFDDNIISELLEISWWDWPIDKIKENISLLMSDEIIKNIQYLKKLR